MRKASSKHGIARHVRQQAQFDLRVVGDDQLPAFAGMKAARISRPSSVRMGMFCRLGFEEERRPVAAPVWLKVVCRRPVAGGSAAAARRRKCPSAW